MSGLGRFCCRSPLQAFLVSDSVAVMRFATGAGHDGAADSATGAEPARWLQFILSPAAEAQRRPLGAPASVEELYRTPEPLPGLRAGPYEYSLTRVALPPGMPANPPHYRSGAAMYYVISGSGTFTADGKTEPRAAGMPHFERSAWVHQWANPSDAPLVLLREWIF